MMKKLRNLRKKSKKPLKFKKSRVNKQGREYNELYETKDSPQKKRYKHSPSRIKNSKYENEYSDIVDEYEGKDEDLPQSNLYKHSPSRTMKSPRYNREYEYTDLFDEYEDKNEDLPELKQYKHSPSRMKRNHRKYEYNDYLDEYEGKSEDIPKQYKYSPSRIKKSSRYNRENTDYLDEYEGKKEDISRTRQYKHSPSRIKKSPNYNRKYEFTDNGDEYEGNIEDLQQSNIYKHSPSRMQKSSKYNREYEYTDYNIKNKDSQYNYGDEKHIYNSSDEMLEYATEDTSKYRTHPGRTREYYDRAQEEYFEDSDSDCPTCTNRRPQRSDYESEYPSEYQREDIPTRYRNRLRKNTRKHEIIPSEAKIEISPHRQNTKNRFDNRRPYYQEYEEEFDYHDYPDHVHFEGNNRGNAYHRISQEVYVASAPFGNKIYKNQNQYELGERTLGSRIEMEVDDDEKGQQEEMRDSGWKKNQYRYQVFAANTGESQGVFQKQPIQHPREKLLSVTEYNNSVSMIALKNESAKKYQKESQPIVYLPIVMDNSIKLPHSKVLQAKSVLRIIGDKAEKPLEKNYKMNIYLETESGTGNIFQQIQTTQSTHSIPMDKKSSVISKIASMIKTKSKSGYPVQKSYINVAPSRAKPIEQKGSKISIRSNAAQPTTHLAEEKVSKISIKAGGGSKSSITSSRVGVDKPNSPKGSAYYAKIHKKEIRDKKDRRNKRNTTSEGSETPLLSLNNRMTTDNQSDALRTHTIISTKESMQNQTSTQLSATSQIEIKNITVDSKTAPTTIISKQSTFDRNVPLLKQPTHDKSIVISTVKNVPSNQSIIEQQSSPRKDSKIITIKDVSNGQYEESKNVFEQSTADLQPQTHDSETTLPKKKGFGSKLFSKKSSKVKLAQLKDVKPENATSKDDPDDKVSTTSSYVAVQRKKTKEGTCYKSNPDDEFKPEEYQSWKVLSFNSNAFTYSYQIMQYFLGLTIHGTLMEIVRNAKQSD